MSTQSLSGAQYFLTFIDEKTRYTWVYVLKRKGEVFDKFIELFTGVKLKGLRTANGGEYASTEFKAYLRQEGIRHELLVPKTPQQNGVAERMKRTVFETARCMPAESKFWAEAVSTAIYLRNRSPISAVKKMTPYKSFYG